MDEAFADSELEGGKGDKQSKRAAQSAWVTGLGFGGGRGGGGGLEDNLSTGALNR